MLNDLRLTSYIGMGSNLSFPRIQLQKALRAINETANIKIICCSSFYDTTPLGPQNQPNYVNAVVKIITSLSPQQLLDNLKKIEHKHGRKLNERWGARVIDLDILLYGNIILNTELLTIPHKQIKYRDFVLYPLLEICPNLILPTGEHIKTLIKQKKNSCLIHS